MKISLVINADSRAGWLDPFTSIRERGDGNLTGCRSADFMIEGVRNKRKLFVADGVDLETILVVDQHEDFTPEISRELEAMLASGELTKLVVERFDHLAYRWNDILYIRTLRHATGDYVAHFDGDAAIFAREGFDFLAMVLNGLSLGAGFVCQQSPVTADHHGMWWASTRFFFCRRETLDLDEAEKCLSTRYRTQNHGSRHCPCFEHIIALISKRPVEYPLADYDNWALINWVHYFRGTLARLNAMPYDDVKRYIFETCGGPCGASDLIGKEIA